MGSLILGLRVYVETNPLIAAMEGEGPIRIKMDRVLKADDVTLVSSELTLAEALVKPLGRRLRDAEDSSATELALAYEDMFGERGIFDAVPVSAAILYRAAMLRAERSSLKLPDAIHLATAIWSRCDVLVSNDGPLGKAAEDLIDVCSLAEADLDALLERLSPQ